MMTHENKEQGWGYILIDNRIREFNQNWHFKLNANAKDAVKPDADVSSWKKLDLPHDWSIYNDFDHDSPAQNEGGQLNGGDAWYRKTFKLDEEDLNKNVRITFDGVYMDSQVYVNGQLVAHYPNGYNQFSYDITDYLHKDGRENIVAVHAINKQPSSRWYSGSGIYRDVTLQVTDKVHTEKNGTTILTPDLEKQQNGKVDTHVTSKIVNTDDKDHEILAEYQIIERNGQAVTDLVRTASQVLKAHQSTSLNAILQVDKPKLWTVLNDKPALSEVVTRVYRDGQLVDAKKDLFGYRYYNWTPNEGFSLNGERIKFHGVSLHHDHGALGAEENYKAEYRRLKQMKDMGVNSIRTTQLVSRLYRSLLSLVCWSKKKPSILGMVVRSSMTTVASLIKMPLTQKLKKVKNGLILTCVPWSKEARTTLLSSCGLSVMKSVKQMGNLVL